MICRICDKDKKLVTFTIYGYLGNEGNQNTKQTHGTVKAGEIKVCRKCASAMKLGIKEIKEKESLMEGRDSLTVFERKHPTYLDFF